MRRNLARALTTIMTLGIMGMIFFFSMEPAESSDATSGVIAEAVADILRPAWRNDPPEARKLFYDQVQHVIRKCAHFTEFLMLGLSLRLCLESWAGPGRKLTPPSWACGTGWACLDELHQLAVDGRSGQWTDVMIDSAGVLFGVLAGLGFLTLYGRRRRTRKKGAEQ